MRRHILTGCMGSVWGNLVTGIIYVYFGNAIGMSRFQWGVLGAVSAWVIVAQPVGAILGERLGSRKRVWFWFALSDRTLRFIGILGAFLLWRAGGRSAYLLLITTVCIASLLGNIAVPPWFGWLATIIPKDVQGSFWGRRDGWISLAVVLVVLPCGYLMDRISEAGKLGTAALILSAAGLIGLTDLLIHGTIPEPRSAVSSPGSAFSHVLRPLRDRRFKPWLAFSACWNFSVSLGGALCTLYFMENLGFKDDLLGGMIAVTATALVAGIFTARRGGRLVDRWGVQRVLFVSYFFWSFLPVFWLLATPRTGVLWVGLSNIVLGIFSLTANNAGVKLVTRFPPAGQSSMYMAVSNSIANIAAGLGSLAAGSFLNVIGDWSFRIGALVVSGFPMLFVISTVLRLVSVFALVPRIREKGAVPLDRRQFLLPMFFPLPRIIRRDEPPRNERE